MVGVYGKGRLSWFFMRVQSVGFLRSIGGRRCLCPGWGGDQTWV